MISSIQKTQILVILYILAVGFKNKLPVRFLGPGKTAPENWLKYPEHTNVLFGKKELKRPDYCQPKSSKKYDTDCLRKKNLKKCIIFHSSYRLKDLCP